MIELLLGMTLFWCGLWAFRHGRDAWRGGLGGWWAARAAWPQLQALRRELEAVQRQAVVLVTPGERSPAELAAALGMTGAPPAEAARLAVALTDAGPDAWLDAGRDLDVAAQVRFAHEACLRGGPTPAAVDGLATAPLVRAERAVARAEREPGWVREAYPLVLHGGLPLASRLLLQARLAAVAEDEELAARTREQARVAVVRDPAPEPLHAAWATAVAGPPPGAEPPGVTAWRAARPTGPYLGNLPPEAGSFATRVAALDEVAVLLARRQEAPGGLLDATGAGPAVVTAHVLAARPAPGGPTAAEQWRQLLQAVDAFVAPALRAAALDACTQLLRAAAHQMLPVGLDGLEPDDLRWHLQLARGAGDAPAQLHAMLAATATYAQSPPLGRVAYDLLADELRAAPGPVLGSHSLGPGFGPWLWLVAADHPARPWLLTAYLSAVWQRAARVETAGAVGPAELLAVLRALPYDCRPPSSWAFRGVPATDQALLQQAAALVRGDLARRGHARLDDRYRAHTAAHLRRWAATVRTR